MHQDSHDRKSLTSVTLNGGKLIAAFSLGELMTAENYGLLNGGNAKTRMFERLCLSYRVNMIQLINREIQEIQEMNYPPSDILLGALLALSASASTSIDRTKFGPLELAKSSRFK